MTGAGQVGAERPRSAPKVDTAFIVRRLAVYRQKLTAWNQLAGDTLTFADDRADTESSWPADWYGCVQNLEAVFTGYRRLRPDEIANGSDTATALAAYQQDIEYLAGDCDEIMATDQKRLSQKLAGARGIIAAQAGDLLRQYLTLGKNREAGQAYDNFVKLYGAGAATDELRELYSKALRRQGRLAEAMAPLAEIWNDKDKPATGEMAEHENSEIIYADLLLANGKPKEAGRIYGEIARKLSDNNARALWVNNQLRILADSGDADLLASYTGVLQSYYTFDGWNVPADIAANWAAIDNADATAMRDNAAIIRKKVAAEIAGRTDRQLAKIDELVGGGEFAQARDLAKKLLSLVPDARREEVMAARARIKVAQDAARRAKRHIDKQKIERQWQIAEDLFDRRQYRAAIEAYGQLSTSSYTAAARAKIAEAANLAAMEARKKAAALFFKARKTDDPQLKQRLLLQSRDLLRQIATEYPDVGIITSIKRNLQILNTQLAPGLPPPEK
jgi:Arc/MetJ-type ribon-helix-helix transcriptional regulator